MSSIIKLQHVIITAIIFAIFAILSFTQKDFIENHYITFPDKSKIKAAFESHHASMREKVEYIDENIYNEDSLLSFFYIDNNDLFSKTKSGLFLYKNNELKYWTTNNIPLPTSTTPLFFSKKILNLNNGWYSSETIIREDYHIIALLQIKQEYSYQNDLLYKRFNPTLHIKDAYDIVLDSVKNSIPINICKESQGVFFLIPDQNASELKINYFKIAVYIVLFLTGLILLLFSFKYIITMLPRYNALLILIMIFILIVVRYFMISEKLPAYMYEFRLFSPQLFAQSQWLPSLGDYILNTVGFIFICIIFNRYFNIDIKRIFSNKFLEIIFQISMSLMICFSCLICSYLFYGLVWNSSISFSFDNIINLDFYSFIGLSIIISIITGFILIFDKLFTELSNIIKFKSFAIIFLLISVVFLISVDFPIISIYSQIFFVGVFYTLFVFIAYLRLGNYDYNYFKYVVLLFLIALLCVERFTTLSEEKEIDTGRVLAYNLATERDITAEYFLTAINDRIHTNANLPKLNKNREFDKMQREVNNMLLSKRYFNKYDIFITICGENDSLLIEPDNIKADCFEFFDEIVELYGIILTGSNFYFLDNHNGRISYFGKFNFFDRDSVETRLFIEFHSKIFSEGLGYPELLLEKSLTVKKAITDYDHAKYHKGKLITHKGDFKYPVSLESKTYDRKAGIKYFDYKGYIHFVYQPDEDNIIILSKEQAHYSKELVSFSYIFVMLFLTLNIILLITGFRNIIKKSYLTLKAKIQISFISLLMLALIITGSISIYFIIDAYHSKQYEFLEDKVQSVLVELEHEFGQHEEFSVSDIRYLNELFINLSNVFYTDINLFDTEGRLFATSRRELYDQGLKGRYLDPVAYNELIIRNSGSVILNESIDKATYLSAYIPFRNDRNEIIAYLNLPYFARQNEFREEISSFIVAFSNVFLVLTLISVIIGVLISRQVTRPLATIQEKIKQMDINKKTEKIKYDKNDELGGLIKEYNKKVDELTESVNKLTQSERESAWREMAKQIAHEIKNPLTPMKLRVQYLEHTYDQKDKNWERTFRDVTKSLVEQIDILSEIATEFSNFAKMPVPKSETNNIIDIINNSVQLFKSSEKIKFITTVNIAGKGLITADKEQMTRVFNNLIKNSMQAIPDDRQGIINIIVDENEEDYIIIVRDNGKGIDEKMLPKMFQPSFTTKSGGMGLGLSMVKNIIDNNNGKISFNTEKGKGTEFIIEMPKKG